MAVRDGGDGLLAYPIWEVLMELSKEEKAFLRAVAVGMREMLLTEGKQGRRVL